MVKVTVQGHRRKNVAKAVGATSSAVYLRESVGNDAARTFV